MFYAYLRKGYVFLMFLVIVALLSPDILHAQSAILNRTGTIKITRPDRTTATIEKDKALPEVISGSIIEVLTGSIDVMPPGGFIQVAVVGSFATVKVGDRITASIDRETGMADLEAVTGEIRIVTGNTTTLLKMGQRVRISLDKRTGTVQIRSIKGNIETFTVGVRASIPQDAVAKISVDAKTRMVHVESVVGNITVTSVDGEVMMLAKGNSIDTNALAEGEIQTFEEEALAPIIPVEEPAEPEQPEASPHQP